MPFWINIVVALVSFAICALSGFAIIPYLRKVKCGQTILDIGPKWHKNKQGTPTMGGFMFILSTVVAVILGAVLLQAFGDKEIAGTNVNMTEKLKLVFGIVMALLFMLVGFVDDYIKVVKKRNLGLNAKQKIVFQILISVGYLFAIRALGDKTTDINFPFIGSLELGYFYIPLMVLFIIFIVNSVNLTDGIDGLCSSVSVVACLAFFSVFILLNNTDYAIYAIALAGGCLGFLVWNLNPAKVFMGDTGSMFLGGSMVALSFATGYELLIVIIGIIYVIESLSVILQVISFKSTGKRIFKMSPIHHHFEMCKWNEYKIVIVFSIVTFIASLIAVGGIYMTIVK